MFLLQYFTTVTVNSFRFKLFYSILHFYFVYNLYYILEKFHSFVLLALFIQLARSYNTSSNPIGKQERKKKERKKKKNKQGKEKERKKRNK